MSNKFEFCSVIQLLLLKKRKKKETIIQMEEAHSSETSTRTTIYNWIIYFSLGRNVVFDKKRSKQSSEIGKFEKLKIFLKNKSHITQWKLSHTQYQQKDGGAEIWER